MLQTHASGEEFGVWLAPITTLVGRIAVRRACAVVGGASGDAYGLAIYKTTHAQLRDKKEPISSSGSLQVRRVAPLGTHRSSGSVARFNAKLDRDVDLDATVAAWFVGFQSSTATCEWGAPPDSDIATSLLSAHKTVERGTYIGDFPETLTVVASVRAPLPYIRLLSAEGVFTFGSRSQD